MSDDLTVRFLLDDKTTSATNAPAPGGTSPVAPSSPEKSPAPPPSPPDSALPEAPESSLPRLYRRYPWMDPQNRTSQVPPPAPEAPKPTAVPQDQPSPLPLSEQPPRAPGPPQGNAASTYQGMTGSDLQEYHRRHGVEPGQPFSPPVDLQDLRSFPQAPVGAAPPLQPPPPPPRALAVPSEPGDDGEGAGGFKKLLGDLYKSLGEEKVFQGLASRVATPVAAAVGASTGSATAGAAAGAGIEVGALALGALGPEGLVIAGVVLAGQALGESFKALERSARNLSQELAQVSGPLAASEAEREVRLIKRNIEKGEQISPELTSFNQAFTGLEIAVDKLVTDVIQPLIPVLTLGIELISGLVTTGGAPLRLIGRIATALERITGDLAQGKTDNILDYLKQIVDWLNIFQEKPTDIFDQQVRDFLGIDPQGNWQIPRGNIPFQKFPPRPKNKPGVF